MAYAWLINQKKALSLPKMQSWYTNLDVSSDEPDPARFPHQFLTVFCPASFIASSTIQAHILHTGHNSPL